MFKAWLLVTLLSGITKEVSDPEPMAWLLLLCLSSRLLALAVTFEYLYFYFVVFNEFLFVPVVVGIFKLLFVPEYDYVVRFLCKIRVPELASYG